METIKKIMVLAGGVDQVALISRIRNKFKGSYIILIDYSENPVAKKYADKHLLISTMDRDAVLKAAKDHYIDMIIITSGDQPLPIMAYVAEELGLPCYLSYQQTLEITNKRLMKKLMIDNGIPTSNYISTKRYDESQIKYLMFPLIVKPVDSNGSKGVARVDNISEVNLAFRDAVKYSISGEVIIEEFVIGTELSVDAYVRKDGSTTILMCSQLNKFSVNDNTSIIYQSIIPVKLAQDCIDEINRAVTKIAKSAKLSSCPLLVQLITNGSTISVIEFSARIGGGAKYKTIEEVTGFDILDANIDSMFGLEHKPEKITVDNYFSRCHLYTSSGIFNRIEGVDELIKDGSIESVEYNKSQNSVLSIAKSSSDRICSLMIKASTMEELNKKIKKAINQIKVIDIDECDILDRRMYEK